MKAERHSDNVIEFTTKKKEFSVLWVADGHLDNPKTKVKWIKDLFKKYPEAYIIYGGDHSDLMQGKSDRRSSKSSLKNELKESDYLNQVVDYTRANFIEPYKDRVLCFTQGNHNTAITRHLEVDLSKFMLEPYGIELMHTAGYIMFKYSVSKGKRSAVFPIYFQHAPPSGGKRSKGMLSVDLLLAQHPDVKAIISEHIHTAFITPQTVERLDIRTKRLSYQNVWYIQAPTIKAEHEGKKSGYYHEVVKVGATTIGAVKLDFKVKYDNQGGVTLNMTPNIEIYYE